VVSAAVNFSGLPLRANVALQYAALSGHIGFGAEIAAHTLAIFDQ
jgi:hypothetical protein